MTGAEPVGEPGYEEIETGLDAEDIGAIYQRGYHDGRAGWLAELGSDENVERVRAVMARAIPDREWEIRNYLMPDKQRERRNRKSSIDYWARAVLGAFAEGQAHE